MYRDPHRQDQWMTAAISVGHGHGCPCTETSRRQEWKDASGKELPDLKILEMPEEDTLSAALMAYVQTAPKAAPRPKRSVENLKTSTEQRAFRSFRKNAMTIQSVINKRKR